MDKLDWIVIPGGPGLPEDYLKQSFDKILGNHESIHYYTPYGSPKCNKSNVELDELVQQILDVAKERELKYFGLIGHSFGTYLALRALDNYAKYIRALLFISPMPLRYSDWRQSIQNVINKITPNDNSLIAKYTLENKTSEVLKLLFPYYVCNSKTQFPTIDFKINICEKLEAQVPEYDDIDRIKKLTIPFYCISGNKDPFHYANTMPMAKTKVLTNIGHYPFYENLELFKASIQEAEESLGYSIFAQRSLISNEYSILSENT